MLINPASCFYFLFDTFHKSNEPCLGSNFVGERNSYKSNYLFYIYPSIYQKIWNWIPPTGYFGVLSIRHIPEVLHIHQVKEPCFLRLLVDLCLLFLDKTIYHKGKNLLLWLKITFCFFTVYIFIWSSVYVIFCIMLEQAA